MSTLILFQAEDKTGKDVMFILCLYYVFIIILFVHAPSNYISPEPLECLERCFLSLFCKSKEWKSQTDRLYFGDVQNNFGNIASS